MRDEQMEIADLDMLIDELEKDRAARLVIARRGRDHEATAYLAALSQRLADAYRSYPVALAEQRFREAAEGLLRAVSTVIERGETISQYVYICLVSGRVEQAADFIVEEPETWNPAVVSAAKDTLAKHEARQLAREPDPDVREHVRRIARKGR